MKKKHHSKKINYQEMPNIPMENKGSFVMKHIYYAIIVVILSFVYKFYSQFIWDSYESNFWWSNIQLVEKEISFRTESGLFYSYYKQIVLSPDLLTGINDLIHDNITEHPSEINVISRINIAQEIILASIYRTFQFIQNAFSPIDYYVKAVISLHGFLLCNIFLIGLVLGKSIFTGLYAVVFYVANRGSTTRIFNSLPLRESWALPFFWCELLFLTLYFKQLRYSHFKQKCLIFGIFINILLFCLFWQFNQFLLLVQSISVFASAELGVIPLQKARVYYLCVISSLLLVAFQQFGNVMLINSFCLSVCVSALFVQPFAYQLFQRYHRGFISGFFILLVRIFCSIVGAISFYTFTKILFQQESDSHIFRFLFNKFGLVDDRDFDLRLYKCNGGFNWMESYTFTQIHNSGALVSYIFVHVLLLIITAYDCLVKLSSCSVTEKDKGVEETDENEISSTSTSLLLIHHRPELAYNAIQAFLYFLLALTTQRLMLLWTPHALILASLAYTDRDSYTSIIEFILSFTSRNKQEKRPSSNRNLIGRISICGLICVLFLGSLSYTVYKEINDNLNDLREFYDPDTVELMNWINESTPPTASFTGSMQLLAGVKLCTGHPILNHPHYEDKKLRLKTRELYQMYARTPPDVVHSILRSYKANYIILEDSICRAPSTGCRVPDTMDMVNGHIADNGEQEFPDLVISNTPRFCEEIRKSHDESPSRNIYRKYFKVVLINQTFRVYQVL